MICASFRYGLLQAGHISLWKQRRAASVDHAIIIDHNLQPRAPLPVSDHLLITSISQAQPARAATTDAPFAQSMKMRAPSTKVKHHSPRCFPENIPAAALSPKPTIRRINDSLEREIVIR